MNANQQVSIRTILPYLRLSAFICGYSFFLGSTFAQDPARGLDPSAGYARTKLFGLEAQGAKFVYVFDRSGSMGELGGKPLREAKKELLSSLNDLDQRQQFYIVFYNEQPRLFDAGNSKGRLVWGTDDNKKQAAQFIDSIRADGGTEHMSALMVALRMRPDVIFLLTDGEQQDDPSADDLKRIDRINNGSAQINVIQFAPKPREASSLIQLAKQNRGQHIFVDISKYAGHDAGQPAAK
jgi:Mg-chelatase subunit ChlD